MFLRNYLITILFLLPVLLHTQTIYVDHAATGTNDGSSWGNAYMDLQDAIANAASNSEIWIAAGTYYPSTNGDQDASFVLPGDISLYGGFAGTENAIEERDLDLHVTTLSGDYNEDDELTISTDPLELNFSNNGENAYRIVKATGINGNILLDGLTITKGNGSSSFAARMEISSDSALDVIIRDCKFIQNVARRAGALRASGSGSTLVNMTIENTVFELNEATELGSGKGGAVWFTFVSNAQSECKYTNCAFIQNCASGGRGGALTNDGNIVMAYENCLFAKNLGGNGGAVFENNGGNGCAFYNCTFYKNHAQDKGAAIVKYNDFGTIPVGVYNSIFYENDAIGVLYNYNNSSNRFDIANCILQENDFDEVVSYGPGSVDMGGIQYNIDPLFVDLANQDFSLQEISPAVDTGDNDYVNTMFDIAGADRIWNNIVDLGPYEYYVPSSVFAIDQEMAIGVFPNPFDGYVIVELAEDFVRKHELLDIRLFDVMGRLVVAKNVSGQPVFYLDLGDVPEGSYFLELRSKEHSWTKKLLK